MRSREISTSRRWSRCSASRSSSTSCSAGSRCAAARPAPRTEPPRGTEPGRWRQGVDCAPRRIDAALETTRAHRYASFSREQEASDMPIIQCDIREGRTPEQKRALAEAITRVVHETIDAPIEYIYVLIRET